LIIKRKDPYQTILRARPVNRRHPYDRFIVLGDADPAEVERRIGNALMNEQAKKQASPQTQQRHAPYSKARHGTLPETAMRKELNGLFDNSVTAAQENSKNILHVTGSAAHSSQNHSVERKRSKPQSPFFLSPSK